MRHQEKCNRTEVRLYLAKQHCTERCLRKAAFFKVAFCLMMSFDCNTKKMFGVTQCETRRERERERERENNTKGLQHKQCKGNDK